MGVLDCSDFDLANTLGSGQFFRYEQRQGWYYVVTKNKVFRARQEGNKLYYEGVSARFITHFLGLDNNYSIIKQRLKQDPVLARAIQQYSGLRILRQDPWECTLAFLCSQYSNIKKIKKNLDLIAQRFGTRVTFKGFKTHTTPPPKSINDLNALKECALGYRAKYVYETAQRVSDKQFKKLRALPYEKAKQKLLELPGIGEKVADCILLFSLDFTEAFPVDVWIERVLRENYVKNKHSLKELALFGRQRWGKMAGYAQQYLYHARRTQ